MVLFCFAASAVRGQEGQLPAVEFLRARTAQLGVSATDLTELTVVDRYPSPSGVEHVYLGQSVYGLPVYNAGAAVHFRGDEVVHHVSWLQPRLRERAVATVPRLTLREAYQAGYPPPEAVLEEGELVYFPLPDSNAVRLCWQLTIDDRPAGIHYLRMVDAVTGEEQYRKGLSINCRFPEAGRRSAGATPPSQQQGKRVTPPQDGAMYHVFPFGLESPLHGERQLLFEPADPVASPYGWHDTDGRPGAEYTVTRGNNAYAYRDADARPNEPDSGYVADGGAALDFDFPFHPDDGPESLLSASLTQLFYNANVLHDWAYAHGFDEKAGNFQHHNYGNGGQAGDPVLAEAQDGSGSNNATFYTPRDGKPGRMQLFLWRGRTELLEVRYPASVAGRFPSGGAEFGMPLTKEPVAGELAIGLDGSDQPELGCGSFVNAAHLRGKIVLIDRGVCSFQLKAYNAERAGALAVIVSNPANDLFTMSATEDGEDYPVTIPVILVRQIDAEPLREALLRAETVRLALADYSRTPIDGSFDNGIVAHEYGHGISNRIVGGPSNTTCLLNDEQMGEGWSDFFLLAATPRSAHPAPTGREKRSVGVYSTAGPTDSRGFRSQFYSTDPAVNDLTYDRVITASVPHGVGEIWAATLWDMYWALVDTYGFDEDLTHGDGGNNRAVRLVIEAMKYTRCGPGLVDGRDGLLAADSIEHGGADACLLWEVFRRRGLGFSAEQGESTASNDNREAFDPNPACLPTLKISKNAQRNFVRPGDPIVYTLTVRNDKPEAVTGLTITDELPAGITIDTHRIAGAEDVRVSGSQLAYVLPRLGPGERHVMHYTAETDATRSPTRIFGDGVEGGPGNWTTVSRGGNNGWQRIGSDAFSGDTVWHVANVGSQQEHILQTARPIPISGPGPVLRFFTRYDTEPAYDGGVVEVSTNGGTDWRTLKDKFIRHGYRGKLSDRGAAVLRGKPSFWGDSDGYREVILDLGDYRGQSVLFRWRFASDAQTGAGGWWVDQVEVLPEVVTYDGLARVATAEGDRDSSRVNAPGVVVNFLNDEMVGVASIFPANASMDVFPNPAATRLHLRFTALGVGAGRLELIDANGRRVLQQHLALTGKQQEYPISLAGLPAGIYTLMLTEATARTAVRVSVLR